MNSKPTAFVVHVDAEKVRFSNIVKLSEIFSSHPGDLPVRIEFYTGEHQIAILHREGSGGVKAEEALTGALKSIPGVLAAQPK